jgi:hypothetical protein
MVMPHVPQNLALIQYNISSILFSSYRNNVWMVFTIYGGAVVVVIVWFITTYAIGAYHPLRCEFEPRSWRGVLDTTLYDKVCQWLVTDLLFSLGTPVSSTNKTGRHDITEKLSKVALNTITITIAIKI